VIGTVIDTGTIRTRLHPLRLGARASVVLLAAVAAMTGLIPSAALPGDQRPERVDPAGGCASCGTVAAIRTVEIEKTVNKRVAYRVTVRMDDGSYRTLSQPTRPPVAVGDKVRIVDGTVLGQSVADEPGAHRRKEN